MTVIPFAVLLAGFGILRVLRATSLAGRTIGFAVIALVPIQFAYFYVRYFN